MKVWINGQEMPEALEITTKGSREGGSFGTLRTLCYERLPGSQLALLLSLALSAQTVTLRVTDPVSGQLANLQASLTGFESQAVSGFGSEIIYAPVRLSFWVAAA